MSEPSPSIHTATLGILSRADGSCSLHDYRTGQLVWSSVHGPGDCNAQRRIDDRLLIDVIFKPKRVESTNRLFSDILTRICRSVVDDGRHRRALLQVIVQEMESSNNSDGLLATSLTSACLALLDAGVSMHAIFCGVAVAQLDDGRLTLMISNAKVNNVFTFAIRTKMMIDGTMKPQMIACQSNGIGTFQLETMRQAVKLALNASIDIFAYYRQVMEKKLKNG